MFSSKLSSDVTVSVHLICECVYPCIGWQQLTAL